MKKKLWFIVVVLVIISTSCQAVTPAPDNEAELLRQQNQLLSDQLLEAQRQISDLESQIETLNAQIAALQPEPTPQPENPEFVTSLAAEVLHVLRVKDFSALATYVHPLLGVRFSPYAYINTATDLLFTREDVLNFATNDTVYTWGTEAGSGFSIDRTVVDYWDRYVTPQDPSPAWEVLSDSTQKASNTIDNFAEVFPEAVYLEYYQPGTETYGHLDWRSLRLGFQRSSDGGLYLVAIIHDEWTP